MKFEIKKRWTFGQNENSPFKPGGSVDEYLTQDRGGLQVSASLETLRCVFEQDTLSSAQYSFNPGKINSDMTEKMLIRDKKNQIKKNCEWMPLPLARSKRVQFN